MGVIPQNLGNALHYGANAVQTNGVWNFHGQTLAFTVEIYQAVLLEIVLGFSLVLVVLTTVKLARDPYHQSGFAPLAIAFTITIGHLVGIPLTGTSMNPARSFGPAVISGYWDDHWVWWVSPIVGAVFAALVYKSSFLTPVKEN